MNPPYYIVPDVERYRTLDPQSEEAHALSRKIAANIGDYAALRLVLGIDPPEFAKFYPDMEVSTPATMDTIDAFLDKFGGNIPESGGYVPEETISLDETAGYNEEETIADMLKHRRYEEVLQLIESQNLNNPQKSIYFAHQIRFIKKLMAIEKYRNKTKG